MLSAARKAAGCSREEVEALLEYASGWAGRMERGGSAKLRQMDLRKLMDRFNMTDPDVRSECERLLTEAREPGWWYPHTSALRRTFSLLLGFEADAHQLHTYHGIVVPGLLQTEDYARAVMQAGIPRLTSDMVDGRVKVRMERQARLTQPDAPRMHTIVDEGALMRVVGGRDVWRGQLQHLAELASSLPNLTVQVLPFSEGGHAALSGSFTLIQLEAGEWVACVELQTGDKFEDGVEVEDYQAVFSDLVALSHAPARTLDLIRSIVKD